MKHSCIIVMAVSLLTVSCASTKDSLNITESYSLITSSFHLAKEAHQTLVKKYSAALETSRNNKNASIDTKELYTLLDSAKLTNQKSSTMIELSGEVRNIRYKEKVHKYINLLDKLYNNEFRKFILVLGTQSKDRYEEAYNLLQARKIELEKLDNRFSYASDEVRIKYHLQITDSTQVTK